VAIPQPPDRALQRSLQLVRRALDRLVQSRCCMFDGGGLATFETGLNHAVLVIRTSLTSVYVTKVDFDSRDVIGTVGEGILHQSFDVGGQGITPVNGIVRTDLDVHLGPFREFYPVSIPDGAWVTNDC